MTSNYKRHDLAHCSHYLAQGRLQSAKCGANTSALPIAWLKLSESIRKFTQLRCNYPTAALMAAFSEDMERLVTRANVPEVFQAWMKSMNLATPEDYAVMSPTEALIAPNILDEAAKEGPNKVGDATTPRVRVPATKLRLACRKFIEQTDRQDRSEEGLPAQTGTAIKTARARKHGFELVGDMAFVP